MASQAELINSKGYHSLVSGLISIFRYGMGPFKMLYIHVYKYMYAQSLSTYKMMVREMIKIYLYQQTESKNIDLICLKLRLYHAEM